MSPPLVRHDSAMLPGLRDMQSTSDTLPYDVLCSGTCVLIFPSSRSLQLTPNKDLDAVFTLFQSPVPTEFISSKFGMGHHKAVALLDVSKLAPQDMDMIQLHFSDHVTVCVVKGAMEAADTVMSLIRAWSDTERRRLTVEFLRKSCKVDARTAAFEAMVKGTGVNDAHLILEATGSLLNVANLRRGALDLVSKCPIHSKDATIVANALQMDGMEAAKVVSSYF